MKDGLPWVSGREGHGVWPAFMSFEEKEPRDCAPEQEGETMMNFRNAGIMAGLALSVSAAALSAYASEPTVPPAPKRTFRPKARSTMSRATPSWSSRRCPNIMSRTGSRRISSPPASCRRSRIGCRRSRWSSRQAICPTASVSTAIRCATSSAAKPEGWNYGA